MATSSVERHMFGINELSNYRGIAPQTIYNQLAAGTFPVKTKRIGRLLRWDIRDIVC